MQAVGVAVGGPGVLVFVGTAVPGVDEGGAEVAAGVLLGTVVAVLLPGVWVAGTVVGVSLAGTIVAVSVGGTIVGVLVEEPGVEVAHGAPGVKISMLVSGVTPLESYPPASQTCDPSVSVGKLRRAVENGIPMLQLSAPGS